MFERFSIKRRDKPFVSLTGASVGQLQVWISAKIDK